MLVIEDGTGSVPGAEAYASIAEADALIDKRGALSEWNGRVSGLAEKEAFAREAVEYLHSFTWLGQRSFPLTQLLDWPRIGVADVAYNSLPVMLKVAQAYLMLERARGGALLPAWTGAPVKSKSAGGGVGKTFGGAGDAPVRHFPALNGILRGLYRSAPAFGGGGVTRQLVRV